MENKRKHLEFIQTVITRMNHNSFLIKGWSLTIVAGLLVLSLNYTEKILVPFNIFVKSVIILSVFSTLFFWLLDTYYLRQERLFRHLFDDIRQKNEDQIDFDMNTNKFRKCKDVKLLRVCLSPTISLYYIFILVVTYILLTFIKTNKYIYIY